VEARDPDIAAGGGLELSRLSCGDVRKADP
jgi:hypothetical protein